VFRKHKDIYLRSPAGELILIHDIRAFAIKEDMKGASIYNLIKGKSISCKGWTLPSMKDRNQARRDSHSKEATLINPRGEIVKVKNIVRFSEENFLSKDSLYNLINKQRNEYKGWRLYDEN